MKAFSAFLLLFVMTSAYAQDVILCNVTGMNYVSYRVATIDVADGTQCPLVLPSKLTGFEFRVSRHKSGLLRATIENKKTKIRSTAMGGNNEVNLQISLSEAEGQEVGNELGFNDGIVLDDLIISCRPSMGEDPEYSQTVKGTQDCY